MGKARAIHAEHIASAREQEVGRLAGAETRATLEGRTADAAGHATDRAALVALDLDAEAARLANAGSPAALAAVWPDKVPRK